MVTATASVIEYSPIKNVSVTELLEQYNSGALKHLPQELYIRKEVTQENIDNKVIALSYYTPDGYLVRVDDPITFYTDSEGQKRILSGNSRVAALNYMFNHDQYKTRRFADVPVREVLHTPTDNEIRAYQRSSNDFTEVHKPIELGRQGVILKNQKLAELEPEVRAKKIGKKDAGRISTEYAMTELKINLPSYFSNITKIAEKAPDQVVLLVDKGVLTLDGAVKMMEWWKPPTTDTTAPEYAEYVAHTIKELYNIVINEMSPSLALLDEVDKKAEVDFDNLRIQPRHLKKLFKEPLVQPEVTTPASSNVSENTIEESPKVDEGENVSPIGRDEAKENIIKVIETVQSIGLESLTTAHAQDVSTVLTDMLKLMAETNPLFENKDSIGLYEPIREAFMKRFGDTESVVNRIEADKEYPLRKLVNKINKLSKPVSKLYNAVYHPEPVEEIKVQTEELPSVTVLETDTHLGEVTEQEQSKPNF